MSTWSPLTTTLPNVTANGWGIYKLLGLSVGCIVNDMNPTQRREQYNCDITYGTNSEFGFDYLRDNGMAGRAEDQVQRNYYFAIVDEVDSILIDEARTPLIISGPAAASLDKEYRQANRRSKASSRPSTNSSTAT